MLRIYLLYLCYAIPALSEEQLHFMLPTGDVQKTSQRASYDEDLTQQWSRHMVLPGCQI